MRFLLTPRTDPVPNTSTDSIDKTELKELALLFFKLGVTSFGGPAGHIAMMEDEVVQRRRWLARDKFLDLLGATNLIPGPNSTEMAIHIGYLRAGWAGLVVAGSCFILPSMIIVGVIAWAYVRFGKLPQVESLMYGVKPVIIAVILQALYRLGRDAVKAWYWALVGLACAVLNLLGIDELLLLGGTGALVGITRWLTTARKKGASLISLAASAPLGLLMQGAQATGALASFSMWSLFLVFLKTGSVLFGSGYVLLAFLRTDLVERLGWLTESQLIDAVAIGQVTPGPVFTTATFIGYVLGGITGAIVGTVGIFLPAFFFVAVSGPLVPRIRKSATAAAILDGVIVASLALMAVVTWRLGRAAIIDLPTVVLFVVSVVLLVRFRLNSALLVLGGAVFGLIVFALVESES